MKQKTPEHTVVIENRLIVEVKKVEKMLLKTANVEAYVKKQLKQFATLAKLPCLLRLPGYVQCMSVGLFLAVSVRQDRGNKS